MPVTILFYRSCVQSHAFRFLPMVTHKATPGAIRDGSNHTITISATMLRSFTGLGCSTCTTPCETACNRPTVFTGRPLLTSTLIYYVPPCLRKDKPFTCSHMRRRSALGRVSGSSLTCSNSIHHPIHLHAGVRLRYLTLAYYSCRHRSPVSSEVQGAIPDSSSRPLSCNRALPACNVLARFPKQDFG